MLRVQLRKRRGDFSLEVDFHAPVPGVTALFGRSGCGKSTLISLIAGLLSPDEGRVQIGEDVLVDSERQYELDARHRRIGVVFQDARLFPHFSVLGNLQYGARRLPRGAPTPIGFDDVVSMLGLGAMLRRRPQELSGGEKQRVALGRALPEGRPALCEPGAAANGAGDTNIDGASADLTAALTSLRSESQTLGASLSTVQIRQDFTKATINTLQTGSSDLTLADSNEEGANLLALQTRQQLSTTALSLAAQADQNVLRLFQ